MGRSRDAHRRCDSVHRAAREFRVELPSERRLLASSSGVRVERLRNPVKAATYHGLAVSERPDGFVATVVLDV